MSGTGKLYRVLKPGVRQREGGVPTGGLRLRAVGDLITVSDKGAAYLIGLGCIEPAEGLHVERSITVAHEPAAVAATSAPRPVLPAATARCPDHPRYLGRGEPHEGCEPCARIHAASHAHEVHP